MSLNYIGSKKSLLSFLDVPIKKIVSKQKETLTFFDGFAAASVWIYYFGFGMIIIVWILTIITSIRIGKEKQKQERLIGF